MPVWWSPKGPFKNRVYKIKICPVCELLQLPTVNSFAPC